MGGVGTAGGGTATGPKTDQQLSFFGPVGPLSFATRFSLWSAALGIGLPVAGRSITVSKRMPSLPELRRGVGAKSSKEQMFLLRKR